MKREHEQKMFLAAMRYALTPARAGWCPEWAHRFTYMDNPVLTTVFSPLGSTFKHRACVVQVDHSLTDTIRMFANGYNPEFTETVGGAVNFYYKDGYDVLAGTGALAAIRGEAESSVLRC
jgi:hypothetical protein